MVPTCHVARSGWVAQTGAGEPAQRASAHLPSHRGELVRGQRGRLGEVDLPILAHSKQPLDHTAVEVHMGVQRAAEALLQKLTAPSSPRALPLRWRSRASMTR